MTFNALLKAALCFSASACSMKKKLLAQMPASTDVNCITVNELEQPKQCAICHTSLTSEYAGDTQTHTSYTVNCIATALPCIKKKNQKCVYFSLNTHTFYILLICCILYCPNISMETVETGNKPSFYVHTHKEMSMSSFYEPSLMDQFKLTD